MKPDDPPPSAPSSAPSPSARPGAAAGFAKSWLPVLIWLAVIFGFSTEAGSPGNTSRLIRPILRWLIPGISETAIERVQFMIRKTAHATEYGVLALLVWRALSQPGVLAQRRWHGRHAALAFVAAAVFALSDEWHQTFVRSRQGQFADVLLDSGGALLALVALWTFGRWRGRW